MASEKQAENRVLPTKSQKALLQKLSRTDGQLFSPLAQPTYELLRANGWVRIAHNRAFLTKKGESVR